MTFNPDCVFCQRIAKGEYDSNYAPRYEANDHVVSFEPLNPVTKGHRLFVPRLHTSTADLSPDITAEVFRLASLYARVHIGQYRSYNLITSAGAAATQSIHHLHVHFVPRRDDDGLHLPWTGQMREPQPTDGPDFHAEHAAWRTHNPNAASLSDVWPRYDH
jgi:histidine triad (HIT) family protein